MTYRTLLRVEKKHPINTFWIFKMGPDEKDFRGAYGCLYS